MSHTNPIINQVPGEHHPNKRRLSGKLMMVVVMSLMMLGLLILWALASKAATAPTTTPTTQATEASNNRSDDGQVPRGLALTIDKLTAVVPAPDTPPAELTPSAPAQTLTPPPLSLAQQRAMAFEQQMLDYRQQQIISAMNSETVVQVSNANQHPEFNTNNQLSQLEAQTAMLQQQLAKQAGMQPGMATIAGAASAFDGQQQKRAFMAEHRQTDYLAHARESALSPYELKVGTIIPAVLTSGINSDLPGQVIASVSQNVFDSATGQHLLIPQGSKLYGVYDSQIAYGQSRVLLAWSRINFPNGTTLNLDTMGGMDTQGFAGFEDKVDNHYAKIFGNALLLGMISGATQAGVSDSDSNNRSVSESVADGVTQQFGQTGSTLIQKNLDVQPRIIIRNGYRFNVMVNKDVLLSPYP